MAHIVQTTQNLAIPSFCFAEDDKEMYTHTYYDARAQPLFYSLNLLTGGVVTVAAAGIDSDPYFHLKTNRKRWSFFSIFGQF